MQAIHKEQKCYVNEADGEAVQDVGYGFLTPRLAPRSSGRLAPKIVSRNFHSACPSSDMTQASQVQGALRPLAVSHVSKNYQLLLTSHEVCYTMADMVSFGVAPVAVAYGLGMRSGLAAVILVFCVGCGSRRLARCNITAVQLANATSCPWRERRLVREGWTKRWR